MSRLKCVFFYSNLQRRTLIKEQIYSRFQPLFTLSYIKRTPVWETTLRERGSCSASIREKKKRNDCELLEPELEERQECAESFYSSVSLTSEWTWIYLEHTRSALSLCTCVCVYSMCLSERTCTSLCILNSTNVRLQCHVTVWTLNMSMSWSDAVSQWGTLRLQSETSDEVRSTVTVLDGSVRGWIWIWKS